MLDMCLEGRVDIVITSLKSLVHCDLNYSETLLQSLFLCSKSWISLSKLLLDSLCLTAGILLFYVHEW